MQFIAITRRRTEKFSDEEFAKRIETEAEHARQLYADGVLRQIWHRADVRGAVLMLEANSEAEARGAVEHLPLYQAGMLELFILVPMKPYAGFGPRG
jgi:muconolactone delta-isomerase